MTEEERMRGVAGEKHTNKHVFITVILLGIPQFCIALTVYSKKKKKKKTHEIGSLNI